MSPGEQRREHQDMFRNANERLERVISETVSRDHRHIGFFCECADEGCWERLSATADEFDDAHLTSQHYFILPGHPRMDGEEAVEENGRYEVVTKENR